MHRCLATACTLSLLLLAGCACSGGDDFCPDGTEAKGEQPPEGTERWCDKAGKREGPYRKWHSSAGALAEEGSYKSGQKFGRWTQWYEDGKPKIEAEYLDDNKEGPYVRYHRNGQKAEEGTYADGEMDGVWTSYHDNGNIKESGEIAAGKRQGKWTNYDQSGTKTGTTKFKDGVEKSSTDVKAVVVENVNPERVGTPDDRCIDGGSIFGAEPPTGYRLWCERAGKEHGMWKSWWENGNRWIEGQYTDGKKTGTWIEWYDNAHVTSKGEYVDGRRQGTWTENYANGNRRTEGDYVRDRKIGAWKNWHMDGRIKDDENFNEAAAPPDLE